MAQATAAGKWVKVPCNQCGTIFPYFKTSNVMRKFCETCAEQRTTSSKQRFEEEKKKGISRTPEDAESSRILKLIPDSVNWNAVLSRISSIM